MTQCLLLNTAHEWELLHQRIMFALNIPNDLWTNYTIMSVANGKFVMPIIEEALQVLDAEEISQLIDEVKEDE